MNLIKEVTKVDGGRTLDIIYMDFSKDFNKVPHGRLPWEVRSHGIPEELVHMN